MENTFDIDHLIELQKQVQLYSADVFAMNLDMLALHWDQIRELEQAYKTDFIWMQGVPDEEVWVIDFERFFNNLHFMNNISVEWEEKEAPFFSLRIQPQIIQNNGGIVYNV